MPRRQWAAVRIRCVLGVETLAARPPCGDKHSSFSWRGCPLSCPLPSLLHDFHGGLRLCSPLARRPLSCPPLKVCSAEGGVILLLEISVGLVPSGHNTALGGRGRPQPPPPPAGKQAAWDCPAVNCIVSVLIRTGYIILVQIYYSINSVRIEFSRCYAESSARARCCRKRFLFSVLGPLALFLE